MTPHYTYISSTDFISNLTFDYVETYSFQRGTDFEENRKLIQVEYDILKAKKTKLDNLLANEEERYFAVVGMAKPTNNFSYHINVGEEHPTLAKN